MATKEAWRDRAVIIGMFGSLSDTIRNYLAQCQSLEQEKVAILDDPARKAEVTKLFNEDPDWPMAEVQAKYVEYKDLYTYLKGLGY